jgi:hypothetical protein
VYHRLLVAQSGSTAVAVALPCAAIAARRAHLFDDQEQPDGAMCARLELALHRTAALADAHLDFDRHRAVKQSVPAAAASGGMAELPKAPQTLYRTPTHEAPLPGRLVEGSVRACSGATTLAYSADCIVDPARRDAVREAVGLLEELGQRVVPPTEEDEVEEEVAGHHRSDGRVRGQYAAPPAFVAVRAKTTYGTTGGAVKELSIAATSSVTVPASDDAGEEGAVRDFAVLVDPNGTRGT